MKRITQSKKQSLDAKWPTILAVCLTVSLAAHMSAKYWASETVAEWIRITFGAMAAAIMLFLTLYSVRRMVLSRKLGSMEGWRRTHLYLGILCVALILMHTNFKVYGQFGVIMVALFFLVIFSGLLGELMYRTVPMWLSKQGSDALELDAKRKQASYYLMAADEIAERASEEFQIFYSAKIRVLFANEVSHMGYLMMTEEDVHLRRKRLFGAMASEVSVQEKLTLKSMENLFKERDTIEFKYSRLLAMRWWFTAHAPATAALITALALHIWSVIYY